VSLHVSSQREFNKWRRKSRELRAKIEDPANAPVVIELMNELDKLQKKYTKMDKRVKTLEAQIGKVYADGYNRDW